MTSQAALPVSAIRSFSLAASLLAALYLLSPVPAMASDEETISPLTGDEIALHINRLLAKNQILGTPQLNLKEKHNPCPTRIAVAPLFNNWKTIKVTCPDNTQWRLLVRVELEDKNILSASASQSSTSSQINDKQGTETEALALRRSMNKGEVILEGDVVMVPISAQQNYGVFQNTADVVGRLVRTPITAQAPIKSRQLEPKYLVEEKNPVIIVLSNNGIYVEMSGISLQNGQLGEAIKVENSSSGKTITGKVIGFRKISPMH